MPIDQFLLLAAGLVLIAAVAVTVAYATSQVARGRATDGAGERGQPGSADSASRDLPAGADGPTTPALGPTRSSSLFVTPASTRQVARVVAFLFLASVAVVVALAGAWPDNEPAIFTLIAIGTLMVVLFMDMLPPAALGRARRPVEGIGALVFLGLLIALTGGVGSPFLLGFFLVVAGTALSLEGLAPIAIAITAAAIIALVGAAVGGWTALQAQELAWIGFSAVALILLADIATAAARSQRQARDEALRASRFDALTGLYNRAFFFTIMEQEIRRSERMGRGFTLLMLDLDDLKPVNDTFGHQWGDRLLRAISDVVRHTVRFTDSAARYGGDEFVVLLPETDAAGGFVVGEKLRRDVAALSLRAADRNVRSSISVGLVCYPADGTSIEQLVAAADVAMYESKRRGKNRIVGYQTRTERVATDIDVDSAQLVQLGPTGTVRTGGDPVPWGPGNESEPLPEPPPHLERLPGPFPGVDPDVDGDPGPDEGGQPRRRSDASGLPQSDQTFDPTSPPYDVGDADAPWLTRTDAMPPPPPRRPDPSDADEGSRPAEPPPQRPAADGRGSGRQVSRSDEIRRTGERPWIALPIEPYDPPEHPKR